MKAEVVMGKADVMLPSFLFLSSAGACGSAMVVGPVGRVETKKATSPTNARKKRAKQRAKKIASPRT